MDGVIRNIALSGKMRAGKTTTAQALMSSVPQGIRGKHIEIGWWIKFLCAAGIGNTSRETLQIFGTDIVREGVRNYFGEDTFWGKLAASSIEEFKAAGYNWFVCSDVRAIGDYWTFKNLGFYMVRLHTTFDLQLSRPLNEGKTVLTKEQAMHNSETALDEYEGKGYFDLEFGPDVEQANIIKTLRDVAFYGRDFRNEVAR